MLRCLCGKRPHTPSHCFDHLDKDKGWSCCVVYVEKGHTPLHAALSIALDKENGQVCCVCFLCGERPHTLHLALRKATHPSPCSGHYLGQEEWSGMLCVLFMWREATHPSPCSGHCSRQGKWSGVLCLLFMWRKATHPSPCSGHHLGQEEWSGMLCVLFMWWKATCLHPALVIAQDKENGQVCCVCCECHLCGERPHAFTLVWSLL